MSGERQISKLVEQSSDRLAQSRALRDYVQKGHLRVAGWLEPLALRSILILDEIQKKKGIEGAMCEIGVHRARLLILLHLLSRPTEQTIGLDLFELMGQNIEDIYGQHNQGRLVLSLIEHGCDMERIKLVAANSTALQPDDIMKLTRQAARIFSVDGGHDVDTALSDMRLASRVMSPAGVVLLDDIFNDRWCGVVEAAARYLMSDHELIPFFYAGNKMFFAASAEYADAYRELMGKALNDVSLKVDTFFGYPILMAWELPKSTRAKIIAKVFGESALRTLRRSNVSSIFRR